jgi:hypothetical protein
MLPFFRNRHASTIASPPGVTLASSWPGASTDYLKIANANFGLAGLAIWHACGWVRFNSVAANPATIIPIIGQHENNTADDSFTLVNCHDGSNSLLCFQLTYDNGSEIPILVTSSVFASSFGAIAASTWYFWDIAYDGTIPVVRIRINADTVNGTDTVTPATTGVTATSPHDLLLGIWSGLLPITPFAGRQASVAFRTGSWWSDLDIDYLYNGGCGILYANVDTANHPNIFTGLYTWHDLKEASGTRVNSQGVSARDMLQVGTISGAAGPC